MREQTGLEPSVNRGFDIGGWPAHAVRYDDDTDEEVVSLYYVFLKAPGGSFTFMAMGYEKFREQLRKSVLSIRPLTDAERNSISGLRMRIAEQESGEDLPGFVNRRGSETGPKFTAALNGVDEEHIGSGQPTACRQLVDANRLMSHQIQQPRLALLPVLVKGAQQVQLQSPQCAQLLQNVLHTGDHLGPLSQQFQATCAALMGQ